MDSFNKTDKIVRTHECCRFGHPEFRLAFDSHQVIEPDVIWLTKFLSQNVASGTRYKPDETVQIGWVILKIKSNEEGTLSLFEPDFVEIPINFVDSVTQTLVQLRLQKSVAESIGFEDQITFPSLRQSCLICTRVKDRGSFMMERFEMRENDSGWYLGCFDDDHDHNKPDNLQRVSLYDAACGMLMCVPFLPLPVQTLVKVNGANFTINYKNEPLTPKSNSFLDQYRRVSSRRN
jgi:hypothetical protein